MQAAGATRLPRVPAAIGRLLGSLVACEAHKTHIHTHTPLLQPIQPPHASA